MASSANLRHDSDKVISKQYEILFPSMRSSYSSSSSFRTTSFSSSSSSSSLDSSYFLDDSPLNPATPLRFSGVPFSWEHLPGIPKKQTSKKLLITKESSSFLLPLPPPTTSKQVHKKPIYRGKKTSGSKKKHASKQSMGRDPFMDALAECSKNAGRRNSHRWNQMEAANSQESRSLSDRLGSIRLYSSCKRTCATAESIQLLDLPCHH